jgi:putative tryptophan/tyrosine transport system substrate-binding protein
MPVGGIQVTSGIGRRKFVSALGGMAVAWPFAARAQQTEAMKRVAILMGGAENQEGQERVAAFRQGLGDRHWQEGRNVHIDIRWGMGDATRIEDYATELVRLAPDAILATNTPTARALKRATETIPIVFAGLSDPIGDGIVASLSQPGGNITGFTSFNAPIAGKWLELLKEISPRTQRADVIFNPKTAPYAIFLPVMEASAPQIGLTLTRAPVGDQAAIETAMRKLASEPDAGLIVMPDIFSGLHSDLIFALATRGRLPSVCPLRSYATAGGLLSYGSIFTDLFRQAAPYVDRILLGEKPRDLPVQEPTKYELVINLKTAKAIGLTVPSPLLARADEVIE